MLFRLEWPYYHGLKSVYKLFCFVCGYNNSIFMTGTCDRCKTHVCFECSTLIFYKGELSGRYAEFVERLCLFCAQQRKNNRNSWDD